MEEEYLWSCSLNQHYQTYNWEPSTLEADSAEEEKEGSKVKPSHRLLIKTAVLMPSAKKDQVTVVQIESEGYNKQMVSTEFLLLRIGTLSTDTKYGNSNLEEQEIFFYLNSFISTYCEANQLLKYLDPRIMIP